MKLTHTRNHGLAGFFISLNTESRVFFSKLLKAYAKLVEVFLSLGLYRDTDNGIGELHSFEHDRTVLVTESITGADILETYTCADIAAIDKLFGILLIRVHLEKTRHTLFLTRTGIEDICAGDNFTGVNAEECQTTNIGVGGNLERESTHGSFARRLTGNDFVGAIGQTTFYRTRIEGAGEVSADSVEKTLNTFVLERRTTDHGHEVHRQGSLTESTLDFLNCNSGGIVEILGHYIVVVFGDFLKHLVMPFLSFVFECSRNFLYRIVGTHCLVVPEDSLHLDEVDNAFKSLLCTDRNLNGAGICAEDILELTHYFEEVSARAVHLVHVADTGHVVFIGLAPYSLRLRLHTTNGAESGNGTVEHTERTLHLDSKVDVSRGVDKVDFIFLGIVVPESGRSSRGDCDTALLLLLHPVHGGCAVMHLADLVGKTGIEKDTF